MSLQKFIIIFITFQLSNLYAQDGFESLGFQAQLSIQDFSNRKASKPVQLNISGSQYFDLDFKLARLSYFGKEINNAGFMRYNGFTDEIEITDSGNVENSELILLKSDKVVPIINDEIYEYLPFRINESNTKIGYLVKIYEGTRIKLYLRKNKQFMEAKIARTSLENSFPPRYVDNIENYISIEGDTPVVLKNSKKAFLDLFNNRSDVKKFIKNKKIKFNKTESIIKIVEYVDKN